MTKPTTGEQQSTDQTKETMPLSEAVHIVQNAIRAETDRLRRIANGEEHDLAQLEGETITGYTVYIQADPVEVAKILLAYDYPLYKVLEDDFSEGMWAELAKMAGLDNIYSVDLYP